MFFVEKNCQTIKFLLAVLLATLVCGCQSSSGSSKNQKTSASSHREKPLAIQNVKRIAILLINTKWNITAINQQRVQSFNAQPYLYLTPSNQLIGSTGCNQIAGTYRSQASSIEIDARAGHEYCFNALAQEADLMDELARVRQYQMSSNTLKLLDAQGRVLIVAMAQ